MLGRLIYCKDQLSLTTNANSEKGYRNLTLITEHTPQPGQVVLPTVTAEVNRSTGVTEYLFPPSISQSTLGGRLGSNSCTVIAVLCGYHFIEEKLTSIDVPDSELSDSWCSAVIDSISEGNRVHDFVYAGAPVNLDVEDIVETFGTDVHVQTVDETAYFVLDKDSSQLYNLIRTRLTTCTNIPSVGVLIANSTSICLCIDVNGNLACIDSHKHRDKGALVLTAEKANLHKMLSLTL